MSDSASVRQGVCSLCGTGVMGECSPLWGEILSIKGDLAEFILSVRGVLFNVQGELFADNLTV